MKSSKTKPAITAPTPKPAQPHSALSTQHSGLLKTRPFRFTLTNSRSHIPEHLLLDALRTYSTTLKGRPFTSRDFAAWPRCPASTTTYLYRFGTWTKALKRAGIKDITPYRYSNEELMTLLEKAWRACGRTPGKSALQRYAGVSQIPYITRWGSLRSACKRLARYHRGLITRKELIQKNNPRAPRPQLKPGVRWSILTRDHHRCTICGKTGRHIRLEVDHITPVSKGGTNDPKNLRTLCTTCNRGKSDK